MFVCVSCISLELVDHFKHGTLKLKSQLLVNEFTMFDGPIQKGHRGSGESKVVMR